MAKLSVCIITRNEENNIKDCLDTVTWADEIVIIDSESNDKTVEIARRYTDQILITPYSFPNLDKVIEKMHAYSTYGARHKLQQQKTSGFLTALAHGAFAFIRGYVLRLGFLDGKEGFMLAFSNAEGPYYKYLKLNFMAKK